MEKQKKIKALQIEFCQWLLDNAKKLQLESSKGLSMIAQAKSADDPKIDQGLEKLVEELGGPDEFEKLTKVWQQSKNEMVKMAQHGAKIDSLVKKLEEWRRLTPTKTTPTKHKDSETLNKIEEFERQKREYDNFIKPKQPNDKVDRYDLLRNKNVVLADKGTKCGNFKKITK